MFVEVTGEKLVGGVGPFCPHPLSILNKVKSNMNGVNQRRCYCTFCNEKIKVGFYLGW